jgi:putative endonuclease
MAFVYILYSSELNKYYVGCTEGSIQERLKKHLTNHKGFTAKAKDWKIQYMEFYPDFKSALNREKQIKSWKSRIKIEDLISNLTSSA